MANYANLHVCRVFPRDMVHRAAGAWTPHSGGGPFWGASSGWHRNPKLLLRRTDGASRATPVYATLTQLSDETAASPAAAAHRDREADHQRSIRLDIFREDAAERYAAWGTRDQCRVDKRRVSSEPPYTAMRQVAHDLELPPSPAGWMLVPSTFHAGECASWVIEVYTKARTPACLTLRFARCSRRDACAGAGGAAHAALKAG